MYLGGPGLKWRLQPTDGGTKEQPENNAAITQRTLNVYIYDGVYRTIN